VITHRYSAVPGGAVAGCTCPARVRSDCRVVHEITS
jgi:hypothetical protein